jgi:hypothetical protein
MGKEVRRTEMGELYLTALDGGKGDAFLLQDDGCNYLIDGGNRTAVLSDIPKNLKTVIVTHNDMDHCCGIISMLKNGTFNIGEIWLPGHWQPILSFIHDMFYNGDSIISDNASNYSSLDDPSLDDLLENSKDDSGMENVSTLINDIEYIFEKNNTIIVTGRCIQFMNNPIHSVISIDLLIKLNNITKIATLAFQNGIEIKWFYPKDSLVEKKVGNFVAMNSEPMFRMKKLKENKISCFNQLYMLTMTNKYSLVFQYEKNGTPKILFTADSGLSFCKSSICYKDQIVVTAPHHGSNNKENEHVYNIINCPDAIYLKSGQIKNVSKKFENLYKKVCNYCKQYNLGYKKAELINKKNTWIISSGYVCTKGICP